jgi:hypothetical protein
MPTHIYHPTKVRGGERETLGRGLSAASNYTCSIGARAGASAEGELHNSRTDASTTYRLLLQAEIDALEGGRMTSSRSPSTGTVLKLFFRMAFT